MSGEMSPDPFDDSTADAFLAGDIPASNAPLGYQHAADLIRTARLPASPSELAAEDQVVAALLVEVRAARPAKAIPTRHTWGKILTMKGAVLATVIFGGGVAVAATGGVPAHVRSAISAGLAAVGLTSSRSGGATGGPTKALHPGATKTGTPDQGGDGSATTADCTPISITSVSTAPGVGVTTPLPASLTAPCSNATVPSRVPASPLAGTGSNAVAPGGNPNGGSGHAPSSTTTTSPPKNTTHGPPAGTPHGPPTTVIATTTTTVSPTRSGNNGNGNNNGKGVGNGKGNSSGKSAALRTGSLVASGTEETT